MSGKKPKYPKSELEYNEECLLSPSQIKKIRLSYGLTSWQFSLLLGWKDDRIKEYESGQLHTQDEDQLFRKLSNPLEMCRFLLG